MAILATRRRWEVTSLCAASMSSLSRQRVRQAQLLLGGEHRELADLLQVAREIALGGDIDDGRGHWRLLSSARSRSCPIRRRMAAGCDCSQAGAGGGHHVPGSPRLAKSLPARSLAASARTGRQGRAPAAPDEGAYTGPHRPGQETGLPESGLAVRPALPPRQGSPSAPAMSAGGGVSKASAAPVTGWRKPSRAACSAWRGKSSSRLPRRRGQGAGGGGDAAQIDRVAHAADGRAPARCTRIWCVRPVASRHSSSATAAAQARSSAVMRQRRACRRAPPPPCACDRADRGRSRPRSPRRRAPARPSTVPGRRGRGRARRTRPTSPASAGSVLATTITPEVSLSSRCTIPGRRSPPIPGRLVRRNGRAAR